MNEHEAQKLIEEIQRDCPQCGPVEYCWKGKDCVIHIAKRGVVTPLLVTSREDYEKLKREGAI
ncbi:MAG: hypothetical protein JSV16_14560 [Candidatus Hydrogenedentota bacterium]|nr:MAG: hypothetical protein JSV16_14560 [Candidatus Hydrogenedentota bacterium]